MLENFSKGLEKKNEECRAVELYCKEMARLLNWLSNADGDESTETSRQKVLWISYNLIAHLKFKWIGHFEVQAYSGYLNASRSASLKNWRRISFVIRSLMSQPGDASNISSAWIIPTALKRVWSLFLYKMISNRC